MNAESGSAGVSWDVFKRLQQAEAEEAEAAKTGGGAGGGNSSSRALQIAAGGDAGEEADVEVAQAQAVDWIVDLWDAAQVEWVLAAATMYTPPSDAVRERAGEGAVGSLLVEVAAEGGGGAFTGAVRLDQHWGKVRDPLTTL